MVTQFASFCPIGRKKGEPPAFLLARPAMGPVTNIAGPIGKKKRGPPAFLWANPATTVAVQGKNNCYHREFWEYR